MNQQDNLLSLDEISAAFGVTVGRLTFDKLQIEKGFQALRSQMAQLEADNAELRRREMAHEKRIADLEAEIARSIRTGAVATGGA